MGRPDYITLLTLLETMNDIQIAEVFDVTSRTVYNWRTEYGLQPKPRVDDVRYQDPDTLRTMLETMNDSQIAEVIGVDKKTISNWRNRFGISPSMIRRDSSHQTYTYDRSFFHSIDTVEKAYALGLIASDGNIHGNGRSISIALLESDQELLYSIRTALEGTMPIHVKKTLPVSYAKRPMVVLNLCSKQMVQDLAVLGIYPNKSLTLGYPLLPSNLESHFIRGLFDGDGHIGKRQFFLVSGSRLLIDGVQKAIHSHTGELLPIRTDPKQVHTCFRLTGSRRNRGALAWIYTPSVIALKRKYEKYVEFWS